MKLSLRNSVFIGVALVVIGLLFVYFKYYYKAPVNWTESYLETREDPFGTSILYGLMEGLAEGKGVKKVDNALHRYLKRQEHGAHANYVFVGEALNLSKEDTDSLLAFAKQGHDVFISAQEIPFEFNRQLHYNLTLDQENELKETDSTATDSANVSEGEMETQMEQEWEEPVFDSIAVDTSLIDSQLAPIDSSGVTDTTTTVSDNFVYQFKYTDDSLIHFHFTHPQLNQHQNYTFQYMSDFRFRTRWWTYFNDSILADSGIKRTLLAYLQPNRPVFYRFQVGKGHVYLHTLPITLTNLYLRQELTLHYANKLFADLQPGVVYWDSYHRYYSGDGSSGGAGNASPLNYLLSKPPLAWAWYLGLFATGTFLLFFGKRQQKVIPLLAFKTNTSMEFAQTLARFYKKGGATKIAEIKMRNFHMFVWEKYKIPSDLPKAEYIARMAQYSGIDEVQITKIFLLVDHLKESKGTPAELLEFQKSIEYFYQHCK